MLYGRRCKIPLSWGNLEEILTLGLEMLAQMEEKMHQIKQNVKQKIRCCSGSGLEKSFDVLKY